MKSSYADEVAAAQMLGLGHSLINFEALVNACDTENAVRRVAPSSEDGEVGVYRGWMLKEE